MANGTFEEVDRWTVWGPVKASFKVNSYAKRKTFKDKETGENVPYLCCRRMVPGGLVMIYVFGEIDGILGKTVTANIELRTKNEEERGVSHYLRARVIKEGAAYKLFVGDPDNSKVVIDSSLPSKIIRENGKKALVGFIAI